LTLSLDIPPTLAASFLDWLLGLSRLSAGDDRAELGWRYPLPGWVWLLVIAGAVLLAGWSYSKLLGPRWGRIALAGLRAGIIVFIVALLAGPMLVVEDYRLEPDWLLVLVDRSASMAIPDVMPDGAAQPVSRDDSLRAALAKHPDLFGPDKLGRDRRVVWLGFDGATREMDAPKDASTLSPPVGQATALRTAIEQAMQRAVGRPISGIVLFTDGRSPQATGSDVVAKLKQQRVGVYPVPLGSRETPLNFSIVRIDAPERAYINDTVPVAVTIDRYPSDAVVDPARVTVRLIDEATGKTLDERKGSETDLSKAVRLMTETAAAGRQTWRVEVVYEPPDGATVTQRELLTADNSDTVGIELVDKPIRVLYVEGYPRWEYRYLKTLLIREKSIDSSMMLLSADRAFAQEGDSPITRLPMTLEELKPYDVVLIGDVPANYFSAEQLNVLRDHVSTNGAGVVWIGGEFATPRSYDNTVLEDLLPMRDPNAVTRVDPSLGSIVMRPEPLAAELNVLRLREDATPGSVKPGRGDVQWPANLPAFLWAQNIGRLKPTAEVLALSNELDGTQFPLITRLRYGGGQSVYIGTDETWRWRFGRGEHYFQQFWIQIIRMIGRERLQRRDDRVYLQVSHRSVQLQQTVQVTLHVRDALLVQRNLPKISVAVSKADDPTNRVLDRIDLTATAQTEATPTGQAAAREYSAQWQASVDGDLVLRVIQPGLDDLNIAEPMTVIHPDDERRQPATDHPRLETLAAETGGKIVSLTNLEELNTLIPKRAQRTANDDREALWDSPSALVMVLLLITIEWVGRKAIRLV